MRISLYLSLYIYIYIYIYTYIYVSLSLSVKLKARESIPFVPIDASETCHKKENAPREETISSKDISLMMIFRRIPLYFEGFPCISKDLFLIFRRIPLYFEGFPYISRDSRKGVKSRLVLL